MLSISGRTRFFRKTQSRQKRKKRKKGVDLPKFWCLVRPRYFLCTEFVWEINKEGRKKKMGPWESVSCLISIVRVTHPYSSQKH